MRKGVIGLFMATAIVVASFAQAASSSKDTITVTGEVVDMGCYLGHASKGAAHAGCATSCINQGMPMGLLTQKGVLYLITMNHDNRDAYKKLKSMAGKDVTVTGHALSRSGLKAIEIESVKPTT